MPTTPNGLPYPSPADAPNVPLHLQQLAEALDVYLPVLVRKTADQSVATNSTTFVDDLHLKITLQPGTYRVQALLCVIGATTGDIKTQWAFSGSSSGQRLCVGPEVAATTPTASMTRATSQTITAVAAYGTEPGPSPGAAIVEDLHIIVNGVGMLQFKWCQNTANAINTTVLTNSRLYVQKIY